MTSPELEQRALVPYDEMERMAIAIAKSGLFGIKTADEALALMILAQAEGRHPGSVAAEYHVIQGRPTLKADAMLARFQAAGGVVRWTEYTDERVAAVFTHPSGGSIELDWTAARAKAAQLTGKDNWANYPRQMLRARVISEGVRTVYPGVAMGIYTPEEAQDLAPMKTLEASHVERPRAVAEKAEAPGASGVGVATAKQIGLLRRKLDGAGHSERAICAAFELPALEAMPFARVNDAIAWIQANAA